VNAILRRKSAQASNAVDLANPSFRRCCTILPRSTGHLHVEAVKKPPIKVTFISEFITRNVDCGLVNLTKATGLPKDPMMAAAYLIKAAEGESGFAAFIVAGLYSGGAGVNQDYDLARVRAVKSRQLGAPDVNQMIATIDATPPQVHGGLIL